MEFRCGKKSVLIITCFYLPGFKGGGPIITIENIVDNLGDIVDFYIITYDRDINDNNSYKNIVYNEWNQVGKGKVFYLSDKQKSFKFLRNLINFVNYDILYLNSFFSPVFTIKPLLLLKFGLLNNNKIIIAPRGEFSKGALNIKKFKKKIYIFVFKLLKFYNKVTFQATSEDEKIDIERNLGKKFIIKIAENLTEKISDNHRIRKIHKKKGEAKLIFLSRISRKKNLLGALKILKNLKGKGKIDFDIYGPIEDRKYWKLCMNLISQLPKNIKVEYKGEIAHKDVINTFSKYHFFFFPTLGENYGHVINESLMAGCPVIISNQTPWRKLEKKGCGWDLSLDKPEEFISKLIFCINLNNYEYQRIRDNTKKMSMESFRIEDKIKQYFELFSF